MIKFTKNIRDFNKKMNNEKNNKRERKNDISKDIGVKVMDLFLIVNLKHILNLQIKNKLKRYLLIYVEKK